MTEVYCSTSFPLALRCCSMRPRSALRSLLSERAVWDEAAESRENGINESERSMAKRFFTRRFLPDARILKTALNAFKTKTCKLKCSPHFTGKRSGGPMASITIPAGQTSLAESRAGRFGVYGGRYVPETLVAALDELEREYDLAKNAKPP